MAPNFIRAYTNLAGIYYQLDEIGLALVYYNRSKELNPNNKEIILMIAECYIKLNQYSDALYILEQYSKDNYEIYITMTNIYYQLEDYDSSIRTLKNAIKIEPNDEQLYMYLAGIQTFIESNDAINTYNDILMMNPNKHEVYEIISDIHYNDNNIYLAIVSLKQSNKPNNLKIANLYYEMGDYENSILYYNKSASEGIDDSKKGLISIANRYINDGKDELVKLIIKETLIYFPNDYELEEMLKELSG